ncbi:MAG: DUF975 family protein [Bacilli bacterium]|nr:DUF975 family protein [Bacilli bacterium]
MNRKEIKAEAKEILRTNMGAIIKPYLLLTLTSLVISWSISENIPKNIDITLSFIFNLLLYPISLGLISYILKFIRKKEFNKKEIFKFYTKFILSAGLYVLIYIFVSLWTLLLVIPGIIAAISYAMAPYLMVDGNDDPLNCITESKKIMNGYKWDYLKFMFSFFWWYLIIIFAFWYVIPYIMVSEALYYEELKKLTLINETI